MGHQKLDDHRTLVTADWLIAILALLLTVSSALAQSVDLANRPIADVRIVGLEQVPEQLLRNQIRIKKGDPYDASVVQQDIVRLTNLGRFVTVVASIEPQPTGSIVLIYTVTEQPLIGDVLFTGNKQIPDEELANLVLLRVGDRVDPFLIDRAIADIKKAYEKKGYFATDAMVAPHRLDKEGILQFQIREGPRPRLRAIKFNGNQRYTDEQLASKIRSKEYFPILRKGQLSHEQLKLDVAQIRQFYHDRGYLDARVDDDIQVSPNWTEAAVTFLIEEGRQYTVASINVVGNEQFPEAQIISQMPLKIGAIFSADRSRQSTEALQDMYGKLGYIETVVKINRSFHETEPKVDVNVTITEMRQYWVGKINVQGNQVTKDKVILRQARGMQPGRPYDRTGLETTRKRLAPSSLFEDARVTILGNADDEVRDALIEVKEKNTGSLSFGAGVSSDAGVAGAIDLVQRNFDIADLPESLGELVTGKGFRGAGQYLAIRAQPGDRRSLYSMTFKEPYILESNFFLDTNFFFFQRVRERWDEERMGGRAGLGQRFGDVYSAAARVRVERVHIRDIDQLAAADVFAVEGSNVLTSLGFTIMRNTTDDRIFPTSGSRMQAGIERMGAVGGDFDLTKASTAFRKFWTVDENFFGHRTVLSMRGEVGYIFEEGQSPLFERFYAGGHRTFRGFDFRGIGPRGLNLMGTPTNDPVGGDFLFLAGLEYNVPIYKDVLRGVVFIDTGTVEQSMAFSNYRVSVGSGIRLKVPFLGTAPFAFDFAIPVLSQSEDEKRVFSFDIAIPF